MRKLIATQQAYPTSDKRSQKHESAKRQVTGTARYVDDLPEPANLLYAAVGTSNVASGTLRQLDLTAVKNSTGVVDVITAADVPGHLDIAPVFDGDPLLAHKQVAFHGQPLFAVIADSVMNARRAVQLAKIDIEPTAPILSVAAAHESNSHVRPPHYMQQGASDLALQQAPHTSEGHLSVGGQEHLYLEGQVSLAIPEEEDRILLYTSSQHPSEVQKLVAEVLNVKLHKVIVDMRRMGGGFGGKETQAAQWACLAALAARRTGRAVKLRLPRQQDMITTGKRHPFENHFTIGFDQQGKLLAADIDINGNCGHSADLSDAIVDRAMFHADNCYFIKDCQISGYRLKTNYVSHTAFRGFGGPQGMIMAEAMMDRIARITGQDPLTVRKHNLYGKENGTLTPYGMEIEHHLIADMLAQLEQSSAYWQRRDEIKAFNETSPIIKKGLALTPVKFGISFTAKHLNQAGALVHIYTDGSIQVNHGGTEMGQGLHTKIAQIAAHEFGVSIDDIEVTATRTDKVPNTSPTAASSGTDLNGKAVQNACQEIKRRLATFYCQEHLNKLDAESIAGVQFVDNKVTLEDTCIDFAELVQAAYIGRVSLSASGFYKTPKIHYDRETGTGRPFFYFAYGAAAAEVVIDTLTGESKVTQVDILHDVGHSLNPALDIGQIEGGFIQGMGWLTSEELCWNADGALTSNNLATYKIPAIGDTPAIFNVQLYDRPNEEESIYHSKAVGEPPFMLAISVWCALKDAIASLADYQVDPQLDPPATPEKVLAAIQVLKQKKGAA
ncbi:xanthine dehydrogenase molybdopterin binding subunit [Marinomonas agarivorans]|nr:xanthine dehydrogenase molybdopterin binding subunit [Marinomonas agarivorans]